MRCNWLKSGNELYLRFRAEKSPVCLMKTRHELDQKLHSQPSPGRLGDLLKLRDLTAELQSAAWR
jgi:hypothetical protein